MADRTVKVVLKGDASSLKGELAAVSAGVRGTASEMTAAEAKSAKFRQGLTTLGSAAGKVGLVAAAGLGVAVMASANFEQSMSKVSAATHETAANMDLLRAAALKAGADTAFSATEAAAGVENLAKAGISTKDILAGGLTGALDLAAAGELGVAEAAEIAASALTQFKLKGQDIPHVADLLAAGAGKAQGEVSDLAAALNQSGLIAAQTGLSIEETTGGLAAFASAGLTGSDAGTSFKTMLQSLTPNSVKAAKAMKAHNLEAYDAKGNFVGLTEYAGKLSRGLADMSDQQRNATLKTIFGSDAVRAAAILYEQGASGIGKWTKAVDDQGYAAETAATKMDNLKGDLEELKGSLETALIGVGGGAQGPLRDLTQGLTKAVNAFGGLSPAAQDVTAKIFGLTAAAGGSIWAVSKLVNFATSASQTFSDLGVSIGGANKKMLALRGGAGVLGVAAIALGSLADESTQTGESMSALANIGGGALLGFAAGGPIGAALGFAGGAMVSLSSSADTAGASMQTGKLDAEAFAGSLDQVTGAATTATRALVLKALQEKTSALPAAQALGVQTRDLIGATLGQEGATRRVNAAIREGIRTGKMMTYENGGQGRAADALSQSLFGVAGQTRGLSDEFRQNQREVRQNQRDTETWTQALKGVPKAVRVKLENLDYAPTIREVRELGREYNLTPKQVRTILQATDDASPKIRDAQGNLDRLDRDSANPTLNARDNANPFINLVRSNLRSLDGDVAQTYIITNRIEKVSRQLGGMPGVATGGHIRGPGTATSDSIPAWLSDGEYVVRAAAVSRYGTGVFDRLNAMSFAGGGKVDRFTDSERGSAVRGFDVSSGLGVSGVRSELAEFRSAIRDAGGDVSANFDRLSKRLLAVSKSYDKHAAAVEKAKDKMSDLRQARSGFAGEVGGTFAGDIFGNGLAGGMLQLRADANDAQNMLKAVRKADKLGLSGGAEKALLASGDLGFASELNTRKEVAAFERLYQQRAQAQGALGRFAGTEVFGKALDANTATIRRLEKRMDRDERQIERRERGMEQAVERGSYRGNNDAARNANRQVRDRVRRK